MLDWFVLLSPLLLLPLVFLYAFVGCTPTFGAIARPPTLTAVVNLKYPTSPSGANPDTDKIVLAWSVFRLRAELDEFLSGEKLLEDSQRSFIFLLTQDSFTHRFDEPTPGQWLVSCAYYTWEEGAEGEPISQRWGEEECTVEIPPSRVITFDITSDGAGGWQVQLAENGCPE